MILKFDTLAISPNPDSSPQLDESLHPASAVGPCANAPEDNKPGSPPESVVDSWAIVLDDSTPGFHIASIVVVEPRANDLEDTSPASGPPNHANSMRNGDVQDITTPIPFVASQPLKMQRTTSPLPAEISAAAPSNSDLSPTPPYKKSASAPSTPAKTGRAKLPSTLSPPVKYARSPSPADGSRVLCAAYTQKEIRCSRMVKIPPALLAFESDNNDANADIGFPCYCFQHNKAELGPTEFPSHKASLNGNDWVKYKGAHSLCFAYSVVVDFAQTGFSRICSPQPRPRYALRWSSHPHRQMLKGTSTRLRYVVCFKLFIPILSPGR